MFAIIAPGTFDPEFTVSVVDILVSFCSANLSS
jgi:hypothetical protein